MGTRVYIGHLSYDCQERDLLKFFKGYGRIREILIKNGFGFVKFDDHKDADDAVYELNGKSLLGKKIILEIARGPVRRNGGKFGFRRRSSWMDKYGPPTRTSYRLIVENLSSRVSWQDLKDYMRQAGEVTYADAHKRRRNEGVVEFASYTDMKTAYNKLNDTELNGRKIRLVKEVHRRSRSSSKSSSRSRSHSRPRSRSHSPRHNRSRSRSPRHSKSVGKSRSPRSHSRSVSRSRSKSHNGDYSLSKSPAKADIEKSERSMSKSHSRSHSRSPAKSDVGSHSLSRSPRTDEKSGD